MEHPAFEDAGSNPGIEIWTIEKFEPVPLDSKMQGKFYNGDSYIVLKTTGRPNSTLSHDAHFWLGSKATQDKMGAAAILTVTLDDQLGGRAVQHREVQGYESSAFLGYFKPAIRYLEGGNESGFTEVETNAGAERRLLRLSGCDNLRIEEVPAEASSLTKENCFILEVEHDIFVLVPEGAKASQRRKIIQVANDLRDDAHNGRATIEIIDEFSSDDDIARFFEALGSGSLSDLAGEQDREVYTREDVTAVYLYRVLGDSEFISMSKPYKQSQLNSDETYILDTPDSGVYVWIGANVDADVKKNYNQIVNEYFSSKGYPAWVNVTRVTEGAESGEFEQYFHSWTSPDFVPIRSMLSDEDFTSADSEESKLLGKSATARGFMPDEGNGSLVIIRISGEEEDISEEFPSKPVLYNSEVYVVKYKYTDAGGEDAYVVYLWTGADSSLEDKKAGLQLVTQLDEELQDKITMVKVPQGKEPRHLLSVFKGHLAVLFGNKADEYKPTNSRGDYEETGVRLFRVEGTTPGVDMRIYQIPESAALLQDDGVFVLQSPELVYVWNGKESTKQEREVVLGFVETILKFAEVEKEIAVVEQGDETEEFWSSLGGQDDEADHEAKWRKAASRRLVTPATLTAVNVTVTGKMKFEELAPDFEQQDLSEDGLYIVDTGEELYIWQGKSIPERYKQTRPFVVQEYINDDGLDRTVESAVVISVKQGREPEILKKLFPKWDDDMWENLTSYEDLKNEIKSGNS